MTAKAVELLAAADALAAQHSQVAVGPRLWREPLWLLTVGVMSVLVVLALAMMLLVRRDSASAEQRQRISRVSEQIKDCVNPAGLCARRSREQTAAAVAQLNAVTIAVVECADQYDGRAAIDRCVRLALAATPTPTPTPGH